MTRRKTWQRGSYSWPYINTLTGKCYHKFGCAQSSAKLSATNSRKHWRILWYFCWNFSSGILLCTFIMFVFVAGFWLLGWPKFCGANLLLHVGLPRPKHEHLAQMERVISWQLPLPTSFSCSQTVYQALISSFWFSALFIINWPQAKTFVCPFASSFYVYFNY